MTLAPAPLSQTFGCPRCHRQVTERFYGPCSTCRNQLHDQQPPDGDEVHFPTTKRMNGSHAIAVRTCDNPGCARAACRQAQVDGDEPAG